MIMTQQHPIIPPEELVASMIEQAFNPLGATGLSDTDQLTGAFNDLVTRAAQWGYDQCLKEFETAMSDVIPPSPDAFQPESELVIRVGKKLGGDEYSFNPEAWEDTARVAIREIADWIKGQMELITSNHLIAEDLLSEANK